MQAWGKFRVVLGWCWLGVLGGCVLSPRGTGEHRAALEGAGRAYEVAIQNRQLPPIPDDPSWRQVLQRAFVANGELEAAYFEWRGAVARIDPAAAYPNTNLAVGFQYMFSDERMKSWDRTTITGQGDPMRNLALPMKARQAGRVALDEAMASGKRFEGAKFDLQKKVLTAYLDFALMGEKIRIQRQNVELLGLMKQVAAKRVETGAAQQDLLKADVALGMAENDLRNMEAEVAKMRAMLNALMGRAWEAALEVPGELPAARQVAANDAELMALGVQNNPELGALARQVQGRKDALELARMEYFPDISPMAGLTGNVSSMVGAMVSVPINLKAIGGMVEEARAMLRSTEAMTRQTRLERGADFVGALYAMRNAERQIALLQGEILPAAQRVLENSRQAYGAGSVGFGELIDSQRMLLEVRLMIGEAGTEREKRLAELEALMGVDVETLVKRKM